MTLAQNEMKIQSIQAQITNTLLSKRTLFTMKERVDNRVSEIERAKQIVEKYKAVDNQEQNLLMVEQKVAAIQENIQTIQKHKEFLMKKNVEVDNKFTEIEKSQLYIQAKSKEISTLIEECVANIVKLGKCPTCMSDLDPSHMEKIRKELVNL